MKGKLKYLIPAIIILSLTIPRPASAQIFTGFFDYFNAAFEGVEELAGPISKFLIYIFFYYIAGVGTLFISSTLLQMILENPDWLSVSATSNPLVFSGWSFIAGLTNMFFILLFVFIALATILKIETFTAKKLLPRLILVALLVNFSLVFVGIPVDISNIFYRTIVTGSSQLVPDIMQALTGGAEQVATNIISQVITLVVLFIIPIIGPFAQLGLVIAIVSTGFVGMILIWLVQGMMCFLMSGILFTYIFLFIARNYIIQFLAMLAPLAFLCMVLPKTRSFWDDWLKMLVEWNTFGIITLLFLIVGLRALDAVMPGGPTSIDINFYNPKALLFWQNIPAFVTYYIFLFVYLTTLLYFSRKYTPELGKFIIGQAKAMGSVIRQQVVNPMINAAKPAFQKAGQWAGKKAGGGFRRWGERGRVKGEAKLKDLENKKGAGAWLRRRGRRFQISLAKRREGIGRGLERGAARSEERQVEEGKKATKGKSEKEQVTALQNNLAQKRDLEAYGNTMEMLESKNLSAAEKEGILGDKEYERMVKIGKERGELDICRYDLERAAPIVMKEKFDEAQKLQDGGDMKGAEALRREARGELFDKVMKPEKMNQASPESLKKDGVVQTVIDRAKPQHLAEISKNFKGDVLDKYQKEIDKRGLIGMERDNARLNSYLSRKGENIGLRAAKSLNEEDKKTIVDKFPEAKGKEEEYYRNNQRTVLESLPETKARKELEDKEREEVEGMKEDPLKLFSAYYDKKTTVRKKELIKEALGDEISIPNENAVKVMKKKRDKQEKRLKREVGEDRAKEILKEATSSWKEDLKKKEVEKEKGGRVSLGITPKHISDAKEKIRKEKEKAATERLVERTRPPAEAPLEEEFREEFEKKREDKTKEMLDEVINKAIKEEQKRAREIERRGEAPGRAPTRLELEEKYREEVEKRLPEELKSLEVFTENKLKEKFEEIRRTKIKELIPEIVEEKRRQGIPVPPEAEQEKIYGGQAVKRLPNDLKNVESFKKEFRTRMSFEEKRETKIREVIDNVIKKQLPVISPKAYRAEAIRKLPKDLRNIGEYKKRPERIRKMEREITYKDLESMKGTKEEGKEKKKLKKEEAKISKGEEEEEIKRRRALEKERKKTKKETQKRVKEILKEQKKELKSNVDRIHKNFNRARKSLEGIGEVEKKKTLKTLKDLKQSIKEARRFEKDTERMTKKLKEKAEKEKLKDNLKILKDTIREAEEFERSVRIDELKERIRKGRENRNK